MREAGKKILTMFWIAGRLFLATIIYSTVNARLPNLDIYNQLALGGVMTMIILEPLVFYHLLKQEKR